MKIGISVQNYGESPSRDFLKNAALEIEKNNLDSIWTSDHIIVRKEDRPWTRVFDSLTTLSFFASIAENVTLGTSILLAALRNPFVVGKQIATLDSLCNGKLIIGVGIGWNKYEFEKIGENFEHRAKTTEESIKKWRKLWRGEFSEDGFESSPLPVQKGGPPILIGGQSPSALKRVASYGDGWHPVGICPEEYSNGIKNISKLKNGDYIWSLRISFSANKNLSSKYVGTDGTTRLRLVGNSEELIKQIEQYKNVGVQHLVCDIREESIDEYSKQIKVLAEIKNVISD